MDKMLRTLLIITITFFNFQSLQADALVEHICPFSVDTQLSYDVEVASSLIKKDLCTLDEIDAQVIQRILNQEVLTKLIESDKKQVLQFVMIAYIPAAPDLIANLLFNTESLDQLLPSTDHLSLLDINNMDELKTSYPDFALIHSDIDFTNSQIYQAKSTYGEGLFRIVDHLVKHAMLIKSDASISLYANLIESDKIFKSAFNMFKLIPYADGTILVSYSSDNIKHRQAPLFMDKIKSSAMKSFTQFVLDMKKMLGV